MDTIEDFRQMLRKQTEQSCADVKRRYEDSARSRGSDAQLASFRDAELATLQEQGRLNERFLDYIAEQSKESRRQEAEVLRIISEFGASSIGRREAAGGAAGIGRDQAADSAKKAIKPEDLIHSGDKDDDEKIPKIF